MSAKKATACPKCKYDGKPFMLKGKTMQFEHGYVIENSTLESEVRHADGSITQVFVDHKHCPKCGYWDHTSKRTVNIAAPAKPKPKTQLEHIEGDP